MRYSNSFKKEKISEKVKWFLKLNPSERHNLAISMLNFVNKKTLNRKHAKGLFKTIQIIKLNKDIIKSKKASKRNFDKEDIKILQKSLRKTSR